MSELKDKKTDQQEIFEEIISLLHAFSMRMDSGRRKKIKEALADGIEEGGECDGKKTEVQQES